MSDKACVPCSGTGFLIAAGVSCARCLGTGQSREQVEVHINSDPTMSPEARAALLDITRAAYQRLKQTSERDRGDGPASRTSSAASSRAEGSTSPAPTSDAPPAPDSSDGVVSPRAPAARESGGTEPPPVESETGAPAGLPPLDDALLARTWASAVDVLKRNGVDPAKLTDEAAASLCMWTETAHGHVPDEGLLADEEVERDSPEHHPPVATGERENRWARAVESLLHIDPADEAIVDRLVAENTPKGDSARILHREDRLTAALDRAEDAEKRAADLEKRLAEMTERAEKSERLRDAWKTGCDQTTVWWFDSSDRLKAECGQALARAMVAERERDEARGQVFLAEAARDAAVLARDKDVWAQEFDRALCSNVDLTFRNRALRVALDHQTGELAKSIDRCNALATEMHEAIAERDAARTKILRIRNTIAGAISRFENEEASAGDFVIHAQAYGALKATRELQADIFPPHEKDGGVDG